MSNGRDTSNAKFFPGITCPQCRMKPRMPSRGHCSDACFKAALAEQRTSDALGTCKYCLAAKAGHATLERGCTCPRSNDPLPILGCGFHGVDQQCESCDPSVPRAQEATLTDFAAGRKRAFEECLLLIQEFGDDKLVLETAIRKSAVVDLRELRTDNPRTIDIEASLKRLETWNEDERCVVCCQKGWHDLVLDENDKYIRCPVGELRADVSREIGTVQRVDYPTFEPGWRVVQPDGYVVAEGTRQFCEGALFALKAYTTSDAYSVEQNAPCTANPSTKEKP